MRSEAPVNNLLPRGCHDQIKDSASARQWIKVEGGKLVFPQNDPELPLHQMGHQKGNRVKEAAGEQLKALLNSGAKEAGRIGVDPSTFAGAQLAGGRIMENDFSWRDHRKILADYLTAKTHSIEEIAAPIAVTLSLLKGSELMAALDEVLNEHNDELSKPNSVLRLWILTSCPYRAKLHSVYLGALKHGRLDEISWAVARLQELPRIVMAASDTNKQAFIGWARAFADSILGCGVESVTDPLSCKVINLQGFARTLNALQ